MKNREIKFRGRCVITGNWAYGYYYISKGHSIIRDEKDNECIVLPKTVGEYTGLKDNNDKDIYEGDIVSILDKTSRQNPYVGEVKWNELVTGFEAYTKELHHALFLHGPNATDNLIKELKQFMRNPRTIEVVGNIYENPELL